MTTPDRDDQRQAEWPEASERWLRKQLASFPPLGPQQRERLAKLLDLGDGSAERPDGGDEA